MSHFYPSASALRPVLTSRRELHTAWRPPVKEDRRFFSPLIHAVTPDDFQAEGPADWGNKVLSEADFGAPLSA